MSLAPASLPWFARHELTLAWRELVAMMTGGSRKRGFGLVVFLGIVAVVLHLLAYGLVARWARGGIGSDAHDVRMAIDAREQELLDLPVGDRHFRREGRERAVCLANVGRSTCRRRPTARHNTSDRRSGPSGCVTGTATGSPAVVRKMIEFCARHNIETVTENFKMSQINEAFEHLESGKARYRIVLENDFE